MNILYDSTIYNQRLFHRLEPGVTITIRFQTLFFFILKQTDLETKECSHRCTDDLIFYLLRVFIGPFNQIRDERYEVGGRKFYFIKEMFLVFSSADLLLLFQDLSFIMKPRFPGSVGSG